MYFWFKKKEIVVDCFTSDIFSFEYGKIESAVKYYPEWWKTLAQKKDEAGTATMKRCRGFTQLYKNSFILPSWTGMQILVGSINDKPSTYKWHSTSPAPSSTKDEHALVQHDPAQFTGFVDITKYQQIKILSMWRLKTKHNVEFMWIDPIWNRKELCSYIVLPGMMEFRYSTDTNINIMFEYREEPYEIKIPVGEPLVMLTPLTENRIVLKHHLVDALYWQNLNPMARFRRDKGIINNNLYGKTKEFIMKHEERNKPKCPFGFGSK